MTRTTIDIDSRVLHELRARSRRDGRSMGQLASELLAASLRAEASTPHRITWNSQPMGARVDIDDPEALSRALEGR